MTTIRSGQLDWLLVEFVRDTPGVVSGVVVSGDGLRLATSPGVGTGIGDQLAAAASGLVSLARGTAHLLGAGALNQTILEMTGGYLFVTSVSKDATLAVGLVLLLHHHEGIIIEVAEELDVWSR